MTTDAVKTLRTNTDVLNTWLVDSEDLASKTLND